MSTAQKAVNEQNFTKKNISDAGDFTKKEKSIYYKYWKFHTTFPK